MPKLTLEEKRLEQLRRQLQGRPLPKVDRKPKVEKPQESLYNLDQRTITPKLDYSPKNDSTTLASDSLYLRKDLTKIFLLAGLAIVAQIFLYFGSNYHLLNLSF